MKNATKSNNITVNKETLEMIIAATTKAVMANLEAEGYISRAKKAEPKKQTKKTSAKVTKVTKEGNKKTSESKKQVRYCSHDKNGHLVVTKSQKKNQKKSHWEYRKNADGTTTVIKH